MKGCRGGKGVELVRRRVRADLHKVSSFYRHSWKIPQARTMIVMHIKITKRGRKNLTKQYSGTVKSQHSQGST